MLSSCGGSGHEPVPPPECTAIINWEIPVERTDGSELLLENIRKYTVFINITPGTNTNTLERTVDITDPALTQWSISGIDPGKYWFYMTVTDTKDRESTFSNELIKTC